MHPYLILAQTSNSAAAKFWDTGAGKAIGALMAVTGIFVVFFTIFKAVKNFAGGKPGEGFKAIFLGLIVAVFLFYPPMINAVIELVGSVINKFLGDEGVKTVIDGHTVVSEPK